jgi:hypothetical protein
MIEFAFNAATSTFTELFAFMTNYEFELRMNFDSRDENDSQERLSTKKHLLTQKTINIKNKMKDIWDFIKKKLTKTQNAQKRYVDRKKHSHSNTNLKTWSDCLSKTSKSSDF